MYNKGMYYIYIIHSSGCGGTADAPSSGGGKATCVGSNPINRTINNSRVLAI